MRRTQNLIVALGFVGALAAPAMAQQAEFTPNVASCGDPSYENAVKNGRGRITLFDENPGPIWAADKTGRISTLIITSDSKEQPESLRLTLLKISTLNCC